MTEDREDLNFPRQLRLVQQRDFQQVFKHTECKSIDNLLVVLARSNQRDYPRLGMAIAKKKIKTAVARHRLKRAIRESFRHHKSQLRGLDIVVMGQVAAATAPNHDIYSHLEKHWQNLAKRCKQRSKNF